MDTLNPLTLQKDKEEIAQQLLAAGIIPEDKVVAIKAYRSLRIFSLHNELQFLLYLSVLLFTTGAGILIYENIDTIGHTVILGLLLLTAGICYYFCFRNFKGFTWDETDFENPVFNYLVLLATLLSCIFIGYLQFQYNAFGTDFGLATLFTSITAFFCAYYFDNRNALSIGITALAATIGITVTPRAVVENSFYDDATVFYYGIILGVLLAAWASYSVKKNLKKHFNLVFVTFALHLISICCITGMFQPYWLLYAIFLAAACYYFYRKSYGLNSTSLFVFTVIYAYIGFNIVLFKTLDYIGVYEFYSFFAVLYPVYFIGSIVLFVKLIRQFKKATNDSN